MRYLLFLTGIVTCCSVFAQTRSSKHPDLSFIRPDSIRIIRDEWGVPHIFAPTDAEVAYGLAWAQCEDDFKTMQDFMLIIKGFSGRRTGIDGVKMDYAIGLLGAEELTRREYHKQVPEHVQKYLRAFAAGVNRWVELNPEQVLIKGRDPPPFRIAGHIANEHAAREQQNAPAPERIKQKLTQAEIALIGLIAPAPDGE